MKTPMFKFFCVRCTTLLRCNDNAFYNLDYYYLALVAAVVLLACPRPLDALFVDIIATGRLVEGLV